MQRPDSELVAGALTGDQRALAEMYERYADRLFGFCYSMLRNRDEAADAVQDTFLKASQKLDQLRDPTKLRSWMFAIARNEVVSRTRQRARIDDREVPEMAADLPDMEQGITRTEIKDLVWEAAAGLQPRDREILELSLREGLDRYELAAVLGVKTSHLHVLMSRMRDRMEKSMGSLLVARLGRDDCSDLNQLLANWDGAFSLAVRSGVTRHIEKCDVCKKKRAAVLAPSSLAAAMPIIVAPVALRERTLAAMVEGGPPSATSPGGLGGGVDTWEWGSDGFPIGFSGAAQKSTVLWAVAAALLLFVAPIVAAFALLRDDTTEVLTLVVQAAPTEQAVPTQTNEPTAAPEPTATAPPATPTPAATPTPEASPAQLVVSSDSINFGTVDTAREMTITNPGDMPLDWTATVINDAFSIAVASGQVPAGGSQTIDVFFDRGGPNEGTVAGEMEIASATQATTVSLFGAIEEPPVIAFVIVSKSTIVGEGPACGADRVILESAVTDASGVESVTAEWSFDGSGTVVAPMTFNVQGVWTALITGIQDSAAPAIDIVVSASDVRGNQSTAKVQLLVLPCDPAS